MSIKPRQDDRSWPEELGIGRPGRHFDQLDEALRERPHGRRHVVRGRSFAVAIRFRINIRFGFVRTHREVQCLFVDLGAWQQRKFSRVQVTELCRREA